MLVVVGGDNGIFSHEIFWGKSEYLCHDLIHFQVNLSEQDELALDYLTKVCLSFSIVFLSFAMAIYIYLR